MRCDVIAEGIVAAASQLDLDIPIVVRLQGNCHKHWCTAKAKPSRYQYQLPKIVWKVFGNWTFITLRTFRNLEIKGYIFKFCIVKFA
jgi:hypothetical protein